MAINVKADPDTMASMITSYRNQLSILKTAVQTMYTGIEDLNAVWEGPRHDDFVQLYAQGHESMLNLNKALEAYLDSLEKARRLYDDCESQVGAIIQ